MSGLLASAARLVPWAVLGALVLHRLWWESHRAGVVGTPPAWLYQDDAYYYLQIAWNWSRGLGSSFDGIHATNGYQPLWQWITAVLARFAEDKAGFQALFHWAVVGLEGGAALGLAAVLRRGVGDGLACFAGALLLLATPDLRGAQGMESALYACLLLACVGLLDWRTHTARTLGPRFHVALGLLVAITTLARLEGLLLGGVVGLALLVEWRGGRLRMGSVLAYGVGVAIPLAAFFLWNWTQFGTAMPVSVVIKGFGRSPSLAMAVDWTTRILGSNGLSSLIAAGGRPASVEALRVGAALQGALLASVALVAVGRQLRGLPAALRGRAEGPVSAAAILGTFLLGHWIYVASGAAAPPSTWHFLPEMLGLCVAPVVALAALRRRVEAVGDGRLVSLAVTLLLVVGLGGGGLRAFAAQRHAPVVPGPDGWVEAIRWLDRELPEGTVIGSWNSGYVGWSSRHAVVNLDGLVNELSYWRDYRRMDRTEIYLREQGIVYLADFEPLGGWGPSLPGANGVPYAHLELLASWPVEPGYQASIYRHRPVM